MVSKEQITKNRDRSLKPSEYPIMSDSLECSSEQTYETFILWEFIQTLGYYQFFWACFTKSVQHWEGSLFRQKFSWKALFHEIILADRHRMTRTSIYWMQSHSRLFFRRLFCGWKWWLTLRVVVRYYAKRHSYVLLIMRKSKRKVSRNGNILKNHLTYTEENIKTKAVESFWPHYYT